MAAMFDQYHHVMLLATAAMSDFPGQYSPLDVSDYDLLDEDPPMPSSTTWLHSEGLLSSVVDVRSTTASISSSYSGNSGSGGSTGHSSSSFRSQSPVARSGDGGVRVAFRTKSEVEVLDDGYKWRKYGKKSVMNSPNPRNYYRCSTDGCSVKKRVERDPDEPSYVITTYDGVHNHASTDVVYYATQDSESGRFVVSGCHHIFTYPAAHDHP